MGLFGGKGKDKGGDKDRAAFVRRRYGVVHIQKHPDGGATGGIEFTGEDYVRVEEPHRGRKPRRG